MRTGVISQSSDRAAPDLPLKIRRNSEASKHDFLILGADVRERSQD
jgi:hypothetical protein